MTIRHRLVFLVVDMLFGFAIVGLTYGVPYLVDPSSRNAPRWFNAVKIGALSLGIMGVIVGQFRRKPIRFRMPSASPR